MFRFAYGYAPSDKVEKLEAKAKAPNAPCQKQMTAWIDCMKGAQVRLAPFARILLLRERKLICCAADTN